MEFGSRYHLGELFHIRWLDINNIEALVLDVKIPEIYSQVVAANESLPIAVDGDAINVIGMSIGVGPARYRCNNGVVVGEAGKLQGRRVEKLSVGV
jgi:hypothetical protein